MELFAAPLRSPLYLVVAGAGFETALGDYRPQRGHIECITGHSKWAGAPKSEGRWSELLELMALVCRNNTARRIVRHMNASEIEVHSLDVDSIKVFVGRSRGKEVFDRLKASMKGAGLKVPIQVRDIRDWPAKERGSFRYELVCGQGRLEAARELGWRKIPALILKTGQTETVGRFLAENMIRKPLPWAEKAKLVKADLDAGKSVEDVAKAFFVTPAHVEKCRRILSKGAAWLGDEIQAMSMNEAEVLTTLPAEEQGIVVEVLRETGIDGNVQAAVAKARAVKAETGSLSAPSLKKSLQRVDEDLDRVKDRLKPIRLHYALSVGNLQTLLANPAFRKALKSEGVSISRFEQVTK